jgi:ribosome-binding factor A
MKLRTVPELQFKYDSSIERGARLSRLIDSAVAGEAEHPVDK